MGLPELSVIQRWQAIPWRVVVHAYLVPQWMVPRQTMLLSVALWQLALLETLPLLRMAWLNNSRGLVPLRTILLPVTPLCEVFV
jgi:hypothetical protein